MPAELNINLKNFMEEYSQIKILYGGRMSGKTMHVCTFLLFLASKYKMRILCLRRYQNKLSDSVFSTFKTILDNDKNLYDKYNITANGLTSCIGSEFIFMGIARNLPEIKGLDNINYTFIEEAELLVKKEWDVIRPTILRSIYSTCIAVFNPRYDIDYIYNEFIVKKHDNVMVRKINYTDNHFLNQTAIDLIENDKKNMEDEEFAHIYLGEPLSESADSLIKRKWLNACVDAHKKLNIKVCGKKYIGYDVADDGQDKNAMVCRHGILINYIDEWKAQENELLKSTMRVCDIARRDDSKIIYDSIGVGASVGSIINNINDKNSEEIKHIKFNAGAGVEKPSQIYQGKTKNGDMFANLKAQAWWNIADRIKYTYNAVNNKYETINENNIISISSDIEKLPQLIVELSTPKKDFDNSGRVKVESKKDLSKRGVNSPNCADAFIMSLYEPKEREIRVIQ